MSHEILPGPLCCDAWFTYVYVGVCRGSPLANRVSTSSIEPVHPATNSIPHHVTSSCAPFGRLCGDAWICVVPLHTTCEGSHEELPVLNLQDVLCRHTSSRDVSHHVVFMCSRTACLESGTCPTSPCTSRCGFARHQLTKLAAACVGINDNMRGPSWGAVSHSAHRLSTTEVLA